MTDKEKTTKEKKHLLRERVAKEFAAERMMQQISQEELAERIGTKKSGISRLESGAQNMSVDYIELLAEALHKNVSFVMEDIGPDYGKSTVYELKLYDEPLVRFRLSRGDALPKSGVLWVTEDKRELLPLDLVPTIDGILDWVDRRSVPKNRHLVGSLLSSLGLTRGDLKGLLDIGMALSLNDSYWVTREGFSGSFTQYNLYENRFDAALSLLTYTGYGGSGKGGIKTTPELTTGGMLRKGWHFSTSRGIWLYKGGTTGAANAGNEPYSEFYASQVAQRMGLHAIPYELENWYGILASKCKLFTDIDTSYISIGRIVTEGGIDACIEYYKEKGEAFYEELADMLVFDAVIINEDRHFGNFGVLRDNHTGEIISPAPVFDNGLSLLCYGMKEDFKKENIDEYISSRTNPYGWGRQFFDVAKMVMGKRQKEKLRRLIGFTFEESDVTNLPSWRLNALEEMIQGRVRTLLAL